MESKTATTEKGDQRLPIYCDAVDDFLRYVLSQPQPGPGPGLEPVPEEPLNVASASANVIACAGGHAAVEAGAVGNASIASSVPMPSPTGFPGTSSSSSLGSSGESTLGIPGGSGPPTSALPELIESVRMKIALIKTLSNAGGAHQEKGEGAQVRKGSGTGNLETPEIDAKRIGNGQRAKANNRERRDEKRERQLEKIRRENEMLAKENAKLEQEWLRKQQVIKLLEQELSDAKKRNRGRK